MDQIDEEQDNNFKISAQKRALEAELSDLKSNIELLESSMKTVSPNNPLAINSTVFDKNIKRFLRLSPIIS